jgi:hypothetical protein
LQRLIAGTLVERLKRDISGKENKCCSITRTTGVGSEHPVMKSYNSKESPCHAFNVVSKLEAQWLSHLKRAKPSFLGHQFRAKI